MEMFYHRNIIDLYLYIFILIDDHKDSDCIFRVGLSYQRQMVRIAIQK